MAERGGGGAVSAFITAVPAVWEGCPFTGSTCAHVYMTYVKWAMLVMQLDAFLACGGRMESSGMLLCRPAYEYVNSAMVCVCVHHVLSTHTVPVSNLQHNVHVAVHRQHGLLQCMLSNTTVETGCVGLWECCCWSLGMTCNGGCDSSNELRLLL